MPKTEVKFLVFATPTTKLGRITEEGHREYEFHGQPDRLRYPNYPANVSGYTIHARLRYAPKGATVKIIRMQSYDHEQHLSESDERVFTLGEPTESGEHDLNWSQSFQLAGPGAIFIHLFVDGVELAKIDLPCN